MIPSPPRGGPPRQIPLEFGHGAAQSVDDLIVTPANRAAVEFLAGWPHWPTPVAVLAGPTGSGKSHLAAVWRERSAAVRGEPLNLGNLLPEAANGQSILVEDLTPGRLDEAGLFHLINAVREGGARLLLTSRAFPSAWRVGLPDLASRLKATAVVEISEPDDALLGGVIAKLFADRQVEVEPVVVQFLVRRIERSLSAAMTVVDRLDRVALERQTRITRTLAAEIVSALDEKQGALQL